MAQDKHGEKTPSKAPSSSSVQPETAGDPVTTLQMQVQQLRRVNEELVQTIEVQALGLAQRDALLARAQDIVDAATNDAREARQRLRDQEHEVEPMPESSGCNVGSHVESTTDQGDPRSWGGTARAKRPTVVESVIDPEHAASWGGGR